MDTTELAVLPLKNAQHNDFRPVSYSKKGHLVDFFEINSLFFEKQSLTRLLVRQFDNSDNISVRGIVQTFVDLSMR